MKILIVNTFDKGGAAIACKRLHLGLHLEEIASYVLLKIKQNNWPYSVCFKQPEKEINWFNKIINKVKKFLDFFNIYKSIDVLKTERKVFLNNRHKELEWYSFPDSKFDLTTSNLYTEADVINLHWVADFLDVKSFFKKNEKPVVWTLHDMNPFSGGEHYVEKYVGIDEFGFPIKRIFSNEEIRIGKENIEIKKEALKNVNNLTIVAPSEWLAEEARKSEVFKGKPVFCIPYGLDSAVFSPRDKNYSRSLFNIPNDKKVILFVADSIANHRKGFVFLKKALQQLSDSNIVICTVGNINDGFNVIENILQLGPINDERLMSIAYSAADVFVIPSLIDNLPNTVLESLMCDTPVIGFPVGGIPEMIEDGIDGFITDEISVNSLVATINMFLNNTSYFKVGEIRSRAIGKYDQKVQSKKYKDLFISVLNDNK